MTLMSEDDLLRTVLDMANRLGVLAAHFRPAQSKTGRWLTAVQGDGKGFPDLVLAGEGGVLYRELKSQVGRPSAEQRIWLARLTAAGEDAAVWRPADWHAGRIERELRTIRKAVTV